MTTMVVVVLLVSFHISAFCMGEFSHPDSLQSRTLSSPFLCGDTLIDFDGNSYPTVLIGTQCWMQENLMVTHFSDGAAIPQMLSNTDWQNLAMNAAGFGYHSNDSNMAEEYGALYSWNAAVAMEEGSWAVPSGVQGICPDGWHLPSDPEWTILTDYLGGTLVAGGKLKGDGYLQWNFPNYQGSNSSGFSATPGGGISSFYQNLGQTAFYWSSSDFLPSNAWTRTLFHGYASISSGGYEKKNGYSVRCLADSVDFSEMRISSYLKQPTCYGFQDGAIDLSVMGGTSPYSFVWNTGSTIEDLSFIPTGQYSITIIDTGLDTIVRSWFLDQPDELMSSSLSHAVSCPSCMDGAATVELTGGTSPYLYFWANGGSTRSVSGLPVGNITLTVFDDRSCMLTDTVEVSCCGAATLFVCGDSISDIDGNKYKTVQIGDQCWMSENLRVSHNPDGSPINYVYGNSDWAALTNSDAAFSFYSNDSALAKEYGALYTYAAAINDTILSVSGNDTLQGICPDGWHLPSDKDWKELEGAADSQYGFPHAEWNLETWRGYDVGRNLKTDSLWMQASNGDNTSGFSAVPSGYRNRWSGLYSNLGYNCYYWTSTSSPSGSVWMRRISGQYIYTERYEDTYLDNGYSVRCVKNRTQTTVHLVSNLPPGWNYTLGDDFHIIIVPDSANIAINNVPIVTGDYLGVFYDSLGTTVCAGCMQWTGQSLEMFALGDNPQTVEKEGFGPGEEFVWKIWRCSDSTECFAIANYKGPPIVPDTSFFVLNGTSLVSSISSSLIESQDISLPQGWSLVSTYIEAIEPDIDSLLLSLSPYVIIVKDGMAHIYWPFFGLNSIGDILPVNGYQIKMSVSQVVSIEGYAVIPQLTSISLPQGWSIIGYLRKTPGLVDDMLGSIVGEIVIVKNGTGQVFWPSFSLNTIGNMNPGEGYQIKMNSQQILVYPPN